MSTVEPVILPILIEDIQAELIRFLASSDIVNDSGHVYSWLNPNHPGFIYPEAMGLYLTLISQLASSRNDPHLTERAHTVARGLQESVSLSGGIGKDGKLYLFDTCMAVTGLLTYKESLQGHVDPAVLLCMARFVVEMTQRRLSLITDDGKVPQVAPHWSTVFGASMLKTIIGLDALAVNTGENIYYTLALEIADEIVRDYLSDGAFHVFSNANTVYCHAHCYALEGLLRLRACGYRDTTLILYAGANRLQSWQNADGSLFNWYNAPLCQQCKVSDATAQAVRIWLAVDRGIYLPAIERALAFLARLRSPELGLYYSASSMDVNSWASIFAIQAMEWYLNGVRVDQIV